MQIPGLSRSADIGVERIKVQYVSDVWNGCDKDHNIKHMHVLVHTRTEHCATHYSHFALISWLFGAPFSEAP